MYVDLITYEIGDIVQSKNKDDINPKKIINIAYIGEGKYQVLYFEDSPNIANVANDYHPYDKDKRAAYYEFLNKVKKFKNKTNKRKAQIEKDDIEEIPIKSSRKEIHFNFKLNFDKP
jgi:hypothetical protein